MIITPYKTLKTDIDFYIIYLNIYFRRYLRLLENIFDINPNNYLLPQHKRSLLETIEDHCNSFINTREEGRGKEIKKDLKRYNPFIITKGIDGLKKERLFSKSDIIFNLIDEFIEYESKIKVFYQEFKNISV